MDFIKHLSEHYNINLNIQQQKAVDYIDGPVLLLAVPGGGKTTVIVSRCANMVINHGIDPESILTLTFSKASALDMKNRYRKIFGSEDGRELHFSTIHSFCYNVLRTYTQRMQMAFPVIIEDEKAPINKSQLLRQINQKHNNSYINDDKLEELSNAVCYVKNMMIGEGGITGDETGIKNFAEIYKNYEAYKRQNNYIDYDDMLTRTLELFTENEELVNAYRNKYKYINVDESQDTSYLQHQIIKCLASPRNNIFMVGDEDQSIYTFRAAFPKALLDFEINYPGAKVLLMENNYRSTKNIVIAANKFIKQNKERYDKNMFTDGDEGIPAKYTCLQDKNDQYEHLVTLLKEENLSEAAVLYRNNASAIPLVDALYSNNIPFYLREAKTFFFKHWVTSDIICFMDLSFDLSNVEAFRQIYYKMNAYLSKTMFEYAVSKGLKSRNLFDALLEYPGMTGKQKTKLLEIKRNILKISKLGAFDAIKHIVEVLRYGEYIKKQSSEGLETPDSLLQIISGLKSIALKAGGIQEFKNRLLLLQQIMDGAKFNKGKNAVTLSTIHSSKGLEFDSVYIIDLFDGQFPSSGTINALKAGEKTLMEEEVRLFYVGATRARNYLELIASSNVDGKKVKPSRFVEQFMAAYRKQTAKIAESEIDISRYSIRDILSEKDLYVGMPVLHNKFGTGNIRFLNQQAGLMEIFFDNHGLKTLSLKTCITGSMIYAIDPGISGPNSVEYPNDGTDSLNNLSIKELRDLALSIGETGNGKVLLKELFKHPDYEVRRRACSAAKKLKDEQITRYIVPCLYANEPQIRQYALKAVLSSKCRAVVEHVKEISIEEDKEYNIRLCDTIIKRIAAV